MWSSRRRRTNDYLCSLLFADFNLETVRLDVEEFGEIPASARAREADPHREIEPSGMVVF
jgi:hypothetical protein